jgi:hypothetical protein
VVRGSASCSVRFSFFAEDRLFAWSCTTEGQESTHAKHSKAANPRLVGPTPLRFVSFALHREPPVLPPIRPPLYRGLLFRPSTRQQCPLRLRKQNGSSFLCLGRTPFHSLSSLATSPKNLSQSPRVSSSAPSRNAQPPPSRSHGPRLLSMLCIAALARASMLQNVSIEAHTGNHSFGQANVHGMPSNASCQGTKLS